MLKVDKVNGETASVCFTVRIVDITLHLIQDYTFIIL